MKSAFQNISTELGGVVSVADVKVEIADMKEGKIFIRMWSMKFGIAS